MVPEPAWLAGVLAIGIPAAAGQLVMAAGRGLTNRLLAEFGQHAVAAFGAGSRVDLLVALPTLGMAAASVSLVGMFAGANRSDLVRSTMLYIYRWALTNAMVLGTSALLASRWVLAVFTDDEATLELGRLYLKFMVFSYPMMAIGMVSGRVLQGLGRGMPSLVITTVRVLLAGVIPAYVAVYLFGAPIEAVWACVLGGAAVSTVLAIFWVRRVVWYGEPSARATSEVAPDLLEDG
jgi:Na+-driven multidrug efflux pump